MEISASELLRNYILKLHKENLVDKTKWYKVEIGFYIVSDEKVVINVTELKEE